MHTGTKNLLRFMVKRRIIGGKHTPEGRMLRLFAHLPAQERNEVEREWEYCITQLQWIFRMKKTGEWHVCLNARKLSEIHKEIGESQ